MNSVYFATKMQLSKARVSPNGAHGDIVTVGQSGVTAIKIIDGIAIVEFIKDSKNRRFVVRDYLHAELCEPPPEAEDEARGEFMCETCGGSYKTPQGLAGHRKHAHP